MSRRILHDLKPVRMWETPVPVETTGTVALAINLATERKPRVMLHGSADRFRALAAAALETAARIDAAEAAARDAA